MIEFIMLRYNIQNVLRTLFEVIIVGVSIIFRCVSGCHPYSSAYVGNIFHSRIVCGCIYLCLKKCRMQISSNVIHFFVEYHFGGPLLMREKKISHFIRHRGVWSRKKKHDE